MYNNQARTCSKKSTKAWNSFRKLAAYWTSSRFARPKEQKQQKRRPKRVYLYHSVINISFHCQEFGNKAAGRGDLFYFSGGRFYAHTSDWRTPLDKKSLKAGLWSCPSNNQLCPPHQNGPTFWKHLNTTTKRLHTYSPYQNTSSPAWTHTLDRP